MDEVRSTEASATAGGPATVRAITAGLEEIHRANSRADAAEARVADLERAGWWTDGQLAKYERRIADLEADRRVSLLETRQARRDARWTLACGILALVALGLAAALILALTGGPL